MYFKTLTLLEIVIPLNLLFSIFGDGVSYMKNGAGEEGHEDDDEKSIKHEELQTIEDTKPESMGKLV